MRTPFKNDTFSLVWKAFKNLYPDKDCKCYWDVIEDKTEDGHEVYGCTYFGTDEGVTVVVTPTLPICDATEIFAHELAHVAVGSNEEHSNAWKAAFDAIFTEYNRIGDEMFPGETRIEVVDGKAYVRDEEV